MSSSFVSFFEFNIRFIGGFLSAYALSGDKVLYLYKKYGFSLNDTITSSVILLVQLFVIIKSLLSYNLMICMISFVFMNWEMEDKELC